MIVQYWDQHVVKTGMAYLCLKITKTIYEELEQ